MNKTQKIASLSVIISIIFSSMTFCATAKNSRAKKNKKNQPVETVVPEKNVPQENDNVPVDLESAVEIKIDARNSNYFAGIENSIISDIENGSPQSLRHGVSVLRKAIINYSENEKVLYNIADSIMTLVWPSEKPLEDVPALEKTNPYIELIKSAKQGYFEFDSPKKDFFQILLPCLVLTSSSARKDFYEACENSLADCLSKKNDSILCNYLMGLLYMEQNQYEKAVPYFDKAIESNSMTYEVLFKKASCLIKLKKYEEVSNILDKLIIQYPSDIKILKLYAETALLIGDYAKAEQYASLVLQQNPSDLSFVLFRAKVFVETGDYLKASSLLDVYAKTYPTDREYLLMRSKIQKEWNKNLNAAVATIENALSRYPNDTDVILYAALLASDTGYKINGSTGGELAQKILAFDENNQKALLIYSQALYNEMRYAESYSKTKKLISVSSSKENLFLHIQNCLALKYNEEAWKNAAQLYDKNPEDFETIKIYISVMISTGRASQASRLINSMLSSSTSSVMKSFLYYERSFLSNVEATQLADLRSSLISNPRNSDALFRMYEIYFNRKDYRKAQYYLKQVVSLNPNNEKYIRLNSNLERLINQ